ncbi:hypothetical protein JL720_15797 [Aureococcus anophagefferens]|nr:hypothetical protein JL720_15797 [Aureococcus anophagefferens]
MRLSAVLEEGFELLRWSVLAASTIGPGTVIVCSKAGADYALTLLWALVLASFVAYALQEGAARLSLLGRTTLGRAMRTMWGGGADATPASCGQAPDAGGSLGAAVSGMRRGVTLATAIALVLSVLIIVATALRRHADDDGAFSARASDAARRRGRLRRGLLRARPVRGGVLERADRRARRGALLRVVARDDDDDRRRQPDGPYTRGVIVFVVLVAVVVGSSGASTVGVVLMAQVINGVLLPVAALCLVLCYNDPAVLRAPPPAFRNASQVACFSATAFLATNGLLSKILSDDASLDAAFVMAFLATPRSARVLRRMRAAPRASEVEMRPSAPSRAPESPSTANPLRVRTDSDSDDDPQRRPSAETLEPMTPHEASRISSVFLEDDEDDVA